MRKELVEASFTIALCALFLFLLTLSIKLSQLVFSDTLNVIIGASFLWFIVGMAIAFLATWRSK